MKCNIEVFDFIDEMKSGRSDFYSSVVIPFLFNTLPKTKAPISFSGVYKIEVPIVSGLMILAEVFTLSK